MRFHIITIFPEIFDSYLNESIIGRAIKNKHISVTTVGNTQNRPQTQSGVYKVKDTAANDTMLALEQELAIPIKQNPPAGITPSSSTEILVVIGEDFQE